MSIAAIRRWSRSSSARFALLFLLLFGSTSALLFGFVYYRAIAYFNAQTDDWLTRETRRDLDPATERAAALERVASHNARDIKHQRTFALFDAAGRHVAGDMNSLPRDIVLDTPIELVAPTRTGPAPLRLMVHRLHNGDRFVATQDLRQTRAFATELISAMIWAAAATLVLGVAGALTLAAAQERRIRHLARSLHQIMAGKLGARLTRSGRRDELDDLAHEVNRTLDELQRLMLEVKSAGDNIAHDMRTPLTRLLANLQRVNTPEADPAKVAASIGEAVDEVQGMIAMFNALLRIAEIDEGARRTGFRAIDLAEVVGDVADYHEVAAIERGITIARAMPAHLPFEGDADLLFEAVGNLLDNAIKYTPDGGRIDVHLAAGPVLRVSDSGPGIPADEQDRVTQRFHRVEASRQLPGNGLGLALVAAIARLHRLDFRVGGAPGCVATLTPA
ncbi:MAG: histidine kinase [Sphingomonas sp. 28-66-16]|nr:MAG: histidine kinase [Sphingomonas sp. 28-66-16]